MKGGGRLPGRYPVPPPPPPPPALPLLLEVGLPDEFGVVLGQVPKIPARPPQLGEAVALDEAESDGVAWPDCDGFGAFDELAADGDVLGTGLLDTVMFPMFGCGNALSPTNFDFVPCMSFMKSDQIASG